MNKTIGMLAHVDAGKTTFAEQLLYHTNSIRNRGRVDHRDAFMDSHEIEKARGITVFAGQAVMSYRDSIYYMLDTPGHVDFSAEMERALRTMDYAVLLLSAAEGVEGHTETVWQLLRRYNVPTFFFINKSDREGADVERVQHEIRSLLTEDMIDLSTHLEIDELGDALKLSETLQNFLAERNEPLLEAYFEEKVTNEQWDAELIAMIAQSRIFPCLHGSALLDIGISDFLHKFDRLTTTDYPLQEQALQHSFAGYVYKIGYDASGTRLTYIKALQGSLGVRETVSYIKRNEEQQNSTEEKATALRIYNGERYTQVERVYAGDLFAVVGLSGTYAGGSVGETINEPLPFEMTPTLTAHVSFPKELPVKDVLHVFRMLEDEDPALGVIWEEELQQLHIRVMGSIQLEVLTVVLKERFGIDVGFGTPEILYRETIAAPIVGYGHFEPLRHYAEVHLHIQPGERGSGVIFEDRCHADDLSVGYRNLVGQHVHEREHHGLLAGAPLTDVKMTLLTGRAHNKHTHGGDFREATYRAIRQGLEKAENILLEPCYRFRIRAELEHIGRIMADVQQAHGIFDPPETSETHMLLTGTVPASTFMDYAAELASFTRGKGTLSLTYGGYQPCHNSSEVIERRGYDKNADPMYTSSSIFCAKGAGYSVPWDEAEAAMHLELHS
ncbi:translation factor GTPase family protein [Saccharibacillus sp. JS10]|uniref:GTP-binding protein n=1 Tax=Saccharibacillus sp. JS10 TaxID=2950552 RepID=UPI002108E1CB|nr:TetM/TetW/TetO/TetS family tetracycline resistance ribosomal protection protein [Saccharibacillus sp. JS10]MCQ4086408.1 TetM/TetW/TetO/TetS family tetracycline resistance ribosomal protection protein [Saccharibacillus sp. JS10]